MSHLVAPLRTPPLDGAKVFGQAWQRWFAALSDHVNGQSKTTLNADMADSGTASSTFVVCPFDGKITSLAAVNHVANTTTKTVLTAKIATVAITHPTWEIAVTAAAGTATIVAPTAANTIKEGQVIEFISDGGSATANQKTTFTATILRN